MQDVVLTCCRDESDIVETFIRFYLRMGFDHIYVVDNGSTDGTCGIINALIEAGEPVTLMKDTRQGYEKHLTEYYQAVGNRRSTRWLFFLDSDEFIFFEKGVKKYLHSLDADIFRLRLQQREMYPESTGQERHGDFLLTRKTELNMDDTTKDITRYHPQAKVFGGKHLIDFPGAVTFEPTDIFIRHYKYRSISQAARKEENRGWSKSNYTDEDLRNISAFGVEKARQWIEICEQANHNREWMNHFNNSLPYKTDNVIADWILENPL